MRAGGTNLSSRETVSFFVQNCRRNYLALALPNVSLYSMERNPRWVCARPTVAVPPRHLKIGGRKQRDGKATIRSHDRRRWECRVKTLTRKDLCQCDINIWPFWPCLGRAAR